MVRVVADLGGQVKRHRKSGLALFQQVTEPPVGLLCGGVARVLPHSPHPAAIGVGLHSPSVRIFPRVAHIPMVFPSVSRQVFRGVQGLDVQPAIGNELFLTFGVPSDGGTQRFPGPLLFTAAGHHRLLACLGGFCRPVDAGTYTSIVLPRSKTLNRQSIGDMGKDGDVTKRSLNQAVQPPQPQQSRQT